ncbi:MAG: TRAP transporter substrate-binding protein [Deltaproteobacteria bacterium]|nr:TRAP transporter substrate-binding protein [Deltaproteobacteria bacterium]
MKMKKWGILILVVAGISLWCFSNSVYAQSKTYTWKMQSAFSAGAYEYVNPKDLVARLEEMAGGRLKIELLPAGAIVPAFEVLDAVHKGVLDAGHGWAGFWGGKHPAVALFGSPGGGPFGMGNDDYMSWLYIGGGIELYNELIQKELKFDVVAFPSSIDPPEPLGWFRKPMKSTAEFKGVKYRTAGMAAELFKEMGMSVVILPGGEIVPSLERGVIDGAEYHSPSADMSIGLHNVRKFFHMPSIHQPTGNMEIFVNRKKWDELPADLKAIVRAACLAETLHFSLKHMDQNVKDLETMVTKHGVSVVETSKEMIMEMLKAWDRLAERKSKESPFFGKVLASQKTWANRMVPFRQVSHPPYDMIADHYWKGVNPYKVVKP